MCAFGSIAPPAGPPLGAHACGVVCLWLHAAGKYGLVCGSRVCSDCVCDVLEGMCCAHERLFEGAWEDKARRLRGCIQGPRMCRLGVIVNRGAEELARELGCSAATRAQGARERPAARHMHTTARRHARGTTCARLWGVTQNGEGRARCVGSAGPARGRRQTEVRQQFVGPGIGRGAGSCVS